MLKKEILTSIFKRKGGEGTKTRLIEDNTILLDTDNYVTEENESLILIYFVNNGASIPDNFTKLLLKFNDNSSFVIGIEKGLIRIELSSNNLWKNLRV